MSAQAVTPRGRTPRRWIGALMVGLLCLSSMSCQATSRRGDAEVAVTERGVCFSVSARSEPGNKRLKLFGMTVSETTRPSGDWQTLPQALWAFAFDPPGNSVEISRGDCLLYGQSPETASVLTPAVALEPHHPYAVTIQARSLSERDVPVVGGYGAVFCLVPAKSGTMTARVLMVSSEFERWKQDVCLAEPSK